MKRALVLSGGGAKGAYAFGCMQAFRQRGITFDEVSGTSAGALNALIWATDSMDEGRDLWSTLSFESVYPVTPFLARWPKRLLWFTGSLYVFLRLLLATLQGYHPPKGHTWLRVIAASLGALPMSGSLIGLGLSMLLYGTLWGFALVAAGLVVGFQLYWSLSSKRVSQLEWALDGMIIFWLLPIFIVAIIALGIAMRELHMVARVFTFGVVGVFATWGTVIVYRSLRRRLSAVFGARSAILGAAPLRRSIERIVTRLRPQCPTWVTIAKRVRVFDPDDPAWSTTDLYAGSPQPLPNATYFPVLRTAWAPRYIDVSSVEPRLACDICLASAALPFGVVPDVLVEGEHYVDGGVTDNTPIHPFVERADEVYVVLLSTYEDDGHAIRAEGLTEAAWSVRRRFEDVCSFAAPNAVTSTNSKWDAPFMNRNVPPRVLPLTQAARFPVVVPFYPTTSLGSLFSGTLNFSGKYSTRAMTLGRMDTLKKLDALAGLQRASSNDPDRA